MTRASATNVTLQFEIMSAVGNLYPVAKTPRAGGVKLTSVCPTCYDENDELVPTSEQFSCVHEHGPFKRGELAKATGTAKNLRYLGSAEEVQEARSDDEGPGRLCNLSAYPAELVEKSTFHIGTPYVFQAENDSPALNLFRAALSETGRIETENGAAVLMGELQIRANAPAKLVTLRVMDGHLLVQELARPENMIERDQPVNDGVGSHMIDQFASILGASIQEFDPEDHKSGSVSRFAAYVEERLGGEVLPLTEAEQTVDPMASLEEQLQQMLAKSQ